jgi:hypothetical protein
VKRIRGKWIGIIKGMIMGRVGQRRIGGKCIGVECLRLMSIGIGIMGIIGLMGLNRFGGDKF